MQSSAGIKISQLPKPSSLKNPGIGIVSEYVTESGAWILCVQRAIKGKWTPSFGGSLMRFESMLHPFISVDQRGELMEWQEALEKEIKEELFLSLPADLARWRCLNFQGNDGDEEKRGALTTQTQGALRAQGVFDSLRSLYTEEGDVAVRLETIPLDLAAIDEARVWYRINNEGQDREYAYAVAHLRTSTTDSCLRAATQSLNSVCRAILPVYERMKKFLSTLPSSLESERGLLTQLFVDVAQYTEAMAMKFVPAQVVVASLRAQMTLGKDCSKADVSWGDVGYGDTYEDKANLFWGVALVGVAPIFQRDLSVSS